MSSHHFVKEGQEPAVLLVEPESFFNVESLLEWAPLIVAGGDCIDEVLTWGIKVDAVVAGTQRVESLQNSLKDQLPIDIVPIEESLFKSAFEYMMQNNQKAVYVIARVSDDLLYQVGQMNFGIQIMVIDGTTKWSLTKHFEKWLPEKQQLFLKRGIHSSAINLKGLKGTETLLEVIDAGITVIDSANFFWIGEFL